LDDTRHLAPPPPADFRQWWDARVGWGVILPELPDVDPATPDRGEGLPEPMRPFLAARAKQLGRAVPIFRYLKDSPNRSTLLRTRMLQRDLSINGSEFGLGNDQIPFYLLIVGSPADIPWSFQYLLNTTHGVGRLDLDDAGLSKYVAAAIGGWKAADPKQSNRALIWSVEGGGDITQLMHDVIAKPLGARLSADPDIQAQYLHGSDATASALIDRLSEARPGLVVTTSHGMTGPLGVENQAAMRASLGVPVDKDFRLLDADALARRWSPDGAIWYAHACCSAGGDSQTAFTDLVKQGTQVAQVLAGVAALGAVTAPLPRSLLGLDEPLRAFIGHVEPTFDCTLKQPESDQGLGKTLVGALYDDLYNQYPVGYALRRWYGRYGSLFASHESAARRFAAGEDTEGTMFDCLRSARDGVSTVILGDPAVCLPPLAK